MGTTRPLSPRCACCNKTSNLMRCSRCTVQLYCSKEHQVADYSNHKAICRDIAKSRTDLEKAEKELRANPLGDPFKFLQKSFGNLGFTLNYLQIRRMYAETVCNMGTYDAVKTQLAEYWAMLDLGRCDAQGLRDVIPTAMLRVYKDYECYAFIKRYCIAERDNEGATPPYRNTEYPDMTIPADPFEPDIIDIFQRFIELPHISSLPHAGSLIILKTRMVLDLKTLEASADMAPFKKLPTEIVDTIRSFIPYSSIIANNRALLEQRDYSKEIIELEAQLSKLYQFAKQLNPHYWPMLFNPKMELPTTLVYLDHGTYAEAHLVLAYSGISWLESPGVIDFVKAKVASGEWH